MRSSSAAPDESKPFWCGHPKLPLREILCSVDQLLKLMFCGLRKLVFQRSEDDRSEVVADAQGQFHVAAMILARPSDRLLRFADPVLDGVLVYCESFPGGLVAAVRGEEDPECLAEAFAVLVVFGEVTEDVPDPASGGV